MDVIKATEKLIELEKTLREVDSWIYSIMHNQENPTPFHGKYRMKVEKAINGVSEELTDEIDILRSKISEATKDIDIEI